MKRSGGTSCRSRFRTSGTAPGAGLWARRCRATTRNSGLQLRLRGRQLPRYALVQKSHTRVTAVTERLVGRVAAPAKQNRRAARQAEFVSLCVENLKLALDAN